MSERTTTKLLPGQPTVDFKLPSTEGEQTLDQYRGEWVVLYFYPKDFTPGCTEEACDFRDLSTDMNAVVLGVSPDDAEIHKRFAAEHHLPFPLLSDTNNAIAKAYGAYGRKDKDGKVSWGILRTTFIIDPEGNVAETFYNIKSQGHAAEVAKRLRELQEDYNR